MTSPTPVQRPQSVWSALTWSASLFRTEAENDDRNGLPHGHERSLSADCENAEIRRGEIGLQENQPRLEQVVANFPGMLFQFILVAERARPRELRQRSDHGIPGIHT